MIPFGKKILGAFIEVNDTAPVSVKQETTVAAPVNHHTTTDSEKFKQHFNHLFSEAAIQGPGYNEFSKMIAAMAVIVDEKARYQAAFAGLQVQGLDQQKLLSTASNYLKLLEDDAVQFNNTITLAMQQKVQAKEQELEAKNNRIQQLSKEISDLQQQITALQQDMKENSEKIQHNTAGYMAACNNLKSTITADIEKIKQYLS